MAEPSLLTWCTDPHAGAPAGIGRLARPGIGRVTVRGLDRVPGAGPLVIVMNHCSLIDGPLLFGHVRRPVGFLVKAEAFTPVLAPILRSCGQIPVVRDTVDPAPIRRCVRLLRGGGALGICPEGRRGDGRVCTDPARRRRTWRCAAEPRCCRWPRTAPPTSLTGAACAARRRASRSVRPSRCRAGRTNGRLNRRVVVDARRATARDAGRAGGRDRAPRPRRRADGV